MRRARLWVAEKLLAAARVLAGREAVEESEEEEELSGPPVVFSAEARRMLAEGEEAARLALDHARKAARPEPEKPLRGSLRERLAQARRDP